MKRAQAWTRFSALALSAWLLAHAVFRAVTHAWLGEAAAVIEITAALVLARRRTRSIGVIIAAAAAALVAMAAMLAGEFVAAIGPFALTVAVLALGRRFNRERDSGDDYHRLRREA